VTSKLVRTAGLVGLLLVAGAPARGATPQEIEKSLKGGTDALKARYGRAPAGGAPPVGENNYGIGPAALAGLALLEAGVPGDDPAVKNITAQVREAAYTQTKTYQISLCLMYLDRYGDPSDVPMIQVLAFRLLVGQSSAGGWGYECCTEVPAADVERLKAMKQQQLVAGKPPAGGGKDAPKVHSEVEKYAQTLVQAKNGPGAPPGPGGAPIALGVDDNSNTQFAAIAVWLARKHGVPVERALDAIEKRFMASQDARTGYWQYVGLSPGGGPAPIMMMSPVMYCAGLVGMATGIARREERNQKLNPPAGTKPDEPKPTAPKPGDPFYNPPGGTAPAPKGGPKRPADARDVVVQRAFAGLGLVLADHLRNGKGLLINGASHSIGDMYFLWSLERVGVIYDVDKIGGIDWYDVGSTAIVRSQSPDGSWGIGGYGTDVNTSFAVLFLCKSNLARDLSTKVQKNPTSTEMRAGTGPSAAEVLPNRPTTPVVVAPPAPILNLPNPSGDKTVGMAADLMKTTGTDFAAKLKDLRDTKGTEYTRALLTATSALEQGERKAAAREALAERLARMTPATLRAMLKANEAELRRAAALACAMKDDKDHIPDLIEALGDADDSVVRAARAGLKSFTGRDLGPATGATSDQKTAAVAAWRAWFAQQKK
jgi:hypothetical protein